MRRFKYSGPVLRYERIVTEKWEGTTMADTPQKAINNLKFRARRDLGLMPNAHINFIGKFFSEIQ